MKSDRLGENICKSHITLDKDKRLYPIQRIFKTQQSEDKLNLKMIRDMKKHSSKDIWMTKRHTERCSTSLAIREMYVKA